VDGVAKELEGADGRVALGCHDFYVGVPSQVVLNVDAEIAHQLCPSD